ncbi:MAG: hypothetical protein NC548_03105 [Lachnospiraceae bacterium]|nr:hypothetical protein [Lachnospiraceae bacterium]
MRNSSAAMVPGGLVICCQRDGGGVLSCPVRTEQRSAELTADYDYGTVAKTCASSYGANCVFAP